MVPSSSQDLPPSLAKRVFSDLLYTKMKSWKRRAAILSILLVAGMVFLMWNMGSLVQSTIVKTGSQLLGTPVTLDSVNINPFKGTGQLRMLVVANPTNYSEGPAVEIQEIAAQIQPTSLMSEKIRVASLTISRVKVAYERHLKSGNLESLIQHLEEQLAKWPTDQESHFQVDLLTLKEIQVEISTPILEQPILSLQLPDMTLEHLGAEDKGVRASEITSHIMRHLLDQLLAEFDEEGWQGLLKRFDSPGGGALPLKFNEVKEKAKSLLNPFLNPSSPNPKP